MSSRITTKAFLLIGIGFAFTSLLVLFYELFVTFEYALFFLLVLFTFSGGLYGIYRISQARQEIQRITVGEGYPILVEKATKKIDMLDENGDAIIQIQYLCRNNSEIPLKRLVSNYSHDGRVVEDTLETFVDGHKAKVLTEEYTTRKIISEIPEISPSLQNLLKIIFDLTDEEILEDNLFTYGFKARINGCFSQMLEEEYSSTHINNPTKEYTFIVSAPIGLRFDPESLSVNVRNRDEIVDISEEKRTISNFWPRVEDAGKRLIWRVDHPKLAAQFILRFKLVKK